MPSGRIVPLWNQRRLLSWPLVRRWVTLSSLVTVVMVDRLVAMEKPGGMPKVPPETRRWPLSYGALSGSRTWEALPRDPTSSPIVHFFVAGS